ncbi:Stk1 family PASTA domain-containing Ser/Thr kinase [Leucobacter chromiireducens]|uniref:non-specific serine/threonine protein kinase n=1 Tax=Leucobacter chromiireducens subsp. solipictus TaxID=398235 RepID=A0ABS1SMG2_9MICO|nr:Stk1 family PASTA domain-containing Ser/Thr kinase [Leucobacter chromiireducens]MBL3680493.1 Stk1 family PASTA domain-containing Ser/Thr kinase [Leucobacter chromiireducens subsp. solipictus]
MSTEEVTMPETADNGEQRILAGRYAIGEFVGQGGMATVYRGTDTKLGRQVAIKVMKADLAGDDQFRSRFRQEAQSASRMAHPTVVRVFDAGDDLIQTADGPKRLPFIVMEYVEGRNLREIMAERKLSSSEAARIVDSVLTALEYSHRAGIVHRDIKPANIMVTQNGQVKVMDFGIARAVSETSSTLQQTTAILGTAAYFSPEQAKGEAIDARTDLYSTAVLLFELLTGVVPFRGDSAVAVAYQHVSERPKPPSEQNPEVTPELDRVVLYGLAKDRAKRFQSASEFREALRLAANGTMPKLDLQQQDTVLFSGGEEVSESDLALRQLAEGGGGSRTQSRPPVMWTWAAILTIGAVIIAVVFWLVTLAPKQFLPDSSREIPALVDLERAEAIELLRSKDLVALPVEQTSDTTAAGHVISSDPESGIVLSPGDAVTIYISTGPESAEIPDFSRMSLEEYTKAIEDLGLTIGVVTTEDNPLEAEGRVLAVTPEVGSKLESGKSVDLTVSSGLVLVPDITGQPMDVASSLLDGLGLSITQTPINNCPAQAGYPILEQSVVGQQAQGSGLEMKYCTG